MFTALVIVAGSKVQSQILKSSSALAEMRMMDNSVQCGSVMSLYQIFSGLVGLKIR